MKLSGGGVWSCRPEGGIVELAVGVLVESVMVFLFLAVSVIVILWELDRVGLVGFTLSPGHRVIPFKRPPGVIGSSLCLLSTASEAFMGTS